MPHICTVVRYGWHCCHHRWSLTCKNWISYNYFHIHLTKMTDSNSNFYDMDLDILQLYPYPSYENKVLVSEQTHLIAIIDNEDVKLQGNIITIISLFVYFCFDIFTFSKSYLDNKIYGSSCNAYAVYSVPLFAIRWASHRKRSFVLLQFSEWLKALMSSSGYILQYLNNDASLVHYENEVFKFFSYCMKQVELN
jgi:hypothetical protein